MFVLADFDGTYNTKPDNKERLVPCVSEVPISSVAGSKLKIKHLE
jgi:hypothetical protein